MLVCHCACSVVVSMVWPWEGCKGRTWSAWAAKQPLEGSRIRVSGNTLSFDQDVCRLSAKVDYLVR